MGCTSSDGRVVETFAPPPEQGRPVGVAASCCVNSTGRQRRRGGALVRRDRLPPFRARSRLPGRHHRMVWLRGAGSDCGGRAARIEPGKVESERGDQRRRERARSGAGLPRRLRSDWITCAHGLAAGHGPTRNFRVRGLKSSSTAAARGGGGSVLIDQRHACILSWGRTHPTKAR